VLAAVCQRERSGESCTNLCRNDRPNRLHTTVSPQLRGYSDAGLNFGDVFADALSRVSGEPLLFKGDNFARTGVARVI
jgi:hypothetical protein